MPYRAALGSITAQQGAGTAIFVYMHMPRALIRHTICKHIHAVVRYTNKNVSILIVAKSNEQQLLNNEDLVCSAIKTLKQPRDDLISEKEAILHKMSMLTAQIQQCNDVTALRAAKTHISFARSIYIACDI